jgi:uncharacterized protein (DUF2141 family)
MRKRLLMLSLALTLPLLGQTHSIRVEITGMEEIKGKIQLRLFNSSKTWLKENKECCFVVLDVKSDTVVHTFAGWPAGEYGLAAFHDENSNGEMDTNFFGMPKERYAFSNQAKGKFGPPGFDKASFQVESDITVLLQVE